MTMIWKVLIWDNKKSQTCKIKVLFMGLKFTTERYKIINMTQKVKLWEGHNCDMTNWN